MVKYLSFHNSFFCLKILFYVNCFVCVSLYIAIIFVFLWSYQMWVPKGVGTCPCYIWSYMMKNIEPKGKFSIESMDEWVVTEIFHWVGVVCVYLLCCNFVNVLWSQMCVCVCVCVCVFFLCCNFFWCFVKPNVCTQ
jgi:hypothetical protein